MELFKVNEDNFSAFISDNPIAVIKFGAEWCPTCSNMEPVIIEVAEELLGVAVFGTLDVDECPDICDKYEIDSVPELFVFENGELKVRKAGGMSKQEIIRLTTSKKE